MLRLQHSPLSSDMQKIRGVLQSARDQHTSAVRERITSVEAMKEVVPLTTQLFELSKETAKLEAANFELRQKVALAAEVKAVLDSWVRFEQGQKASEQEQLVKSIIDKVMKNVNDEKVQKEILSGAVAEIERKSSSLVLFTCPGAKDGRRDGQEQGYLSNKLIDYLSSVIEAYLPALSKLSLF